MTAAVRKTLTQRADYTYRHNIKTGRHGWLRLTPAYSVKVVEEIIDQIEQPLRIFDPFCGTATTALSAAYHGHEGVTTDINPFLIWLGQAKTANYSAGSISAASKAAAVALELVASGSVTPVCAPPIHKIERWWSAEALAFLCALRAAIENVTDDATPSRTLLLVAFCRTLISSSNAAFNHQSMSFKESAQLSLTLVDDLAQSFSADVALVLKGAAQNPAGTGQVLRGDARNPAEAVTGKFDRIITSPPYANRMSYIRELRPYMYWLSYLVDAREAGELDWLAIGGTWGIATSRLTEWEPSTDSFKSAALDTAVEGIRHKDNKNGALLANYVAKYFDDIWKHVKALPSLLSDEAELHYIVGNSTFYGVLLPVEQIYAEMFSEIGCTDVECRAIRKRNSKKELIEFDVVARWR